MEMTEQLIKRIEAGLFDQRLIDVYGCSKTEGAQQASRLIHVLRLFGKTFPDDLRGPGKTDQTVNGQQEAEAEPILLFSAPGRTEIGGNHTDHQQGRVLAASINRDILAAVRPNGKNRICLLSEGYGMDVIDLADLTVRESEKNTSIALIRGIANRFRALGHPVTGFDACVISNVPKGSGLSSSAAFEVLLGNVMNTLFADDQVNPVEIARIGQYAENHYYGKPCGLMDQMASAIGGIIAIDFKDPARPVFERISFDLTGAGLALCILDSGADHGDLTEEYAAIPREMKSVAKALGHTVLRDVDEQAFMDAVPRIRPTVGDRAILRAMHFFSDDRRVAAEVNALKAHNLAEFRRLIIESGRSSQVLLQNTYASGSTKEQSVALVLAFCERHLSAAGGAWRVHGGGFAGTVQAFVPVGLVDGFRRSMEAVFGAGSCHPIHVRPTGGCCVINRSDVRALDRKPDVV